MATTSDLSRERRQVDELRHAFEVEEVDIVAAGYAELQLAANDLDFESVP